MKKLIVILEYIVRGMAVAIATADSRYEEGPQLTSKAAAEKPILVFINSKSGGHLDPELESLLVELYQITLSDPLNFLVVICNIRPCAILLRLCEYCIVWLLIQATIF